MREFASVNKKILAFLLLFAVEINAQNLVNGKLPQLPEELHSSGGIKVACLFGCGGGGSGGLVDQGTGGVSPWLVKFDQTTTSNDVDANITNASLAVTQSGAWSFSLDQTGTANNVDANITNASIAVTGPLTDAQLRASDVPVTVSKSSVTAGTLAATTTAAQIGTGAITKVMVQNDPDNTVDILCGSSTTQPVQLKPGDAFSMEVTNLNLIHCKTVSGAATVAWFAR